MEKEKLLPFLSVLTSLTFGQSDQIGRNFAILEKTIPN
jgi:hypothetical protein